MITEARAGPTSPISTAKIRNAATVQKTTSTASAASAPAEGTREGAESSPAGVRITAAIASDAAIVARASRSARRRLKIIGPIA